MKVLFRFFFAFIFVLGFTECKNPCFETICQNGGTCWDGECQCPRGFIGDHCETLDPNFTCPTIKSCIVNNYIVRTQCTFGNNDLYNSTVSNVVIDTTQVAFSNFDNKNFELLTKLTGTQIHIEAQVHDGIIYEGFGSVDTSAYPYSIELNYNAGSKTCIAVMSLE